MKNRFFILLLMLLSFSSFVQGQDVDEDMVPDMRDEYDAGEFVYADCPFYILPPEEEGETVDCGYLFVPENRSDASSPVIQLAVMAIYATGDDPYDEPIIYLEGGPGGAAITYYEDWYESSLREDYHIILIDQRGTGFSLPSLNCYEADETDEYVEECAERLRDEGVDLDAYNSQENAHDIADLIEALELDSVNLYGISYGSRLALTVMRERPEHIRSVMIEGIYPPNINGYDEEAVAFWGALQNLFDACADDSFCDENYPNLEDVFFEAMDYLDESPMEVEDFETGEIYDMDGGYFADDIFIKMYDYSWYSVLPAMIYAAADGDSDAYDELGYDDEFDEEEDYSDEWYEAFDDALMDYLEFDDYDEMYDYIESLDDDEYYEIEYAILGYIDSDSEGMFTSAECVEEVPFNSMAAFEDTSRDLPSLFTDYVAESLEEIIEDCVDWDVERADAIESELVRSDIPTFIVSGSLDPVTPPYWGDAAAEGLPNSNHYIYPSMGHGAIDNDDCPTAMALEFLENPDSAPDDSCIASMAIEFE